LISYQAYPDVFAIDKSKYLGRNRMHMKSEKIDVTVIICTRNRPTQLAIVLDSACQLTIPVHLNWELIVVDNGSLDNADDVVVKYTSRLPIRLIREDKAGLSNARNRGVAEAKGDYICWVDDDLVIDPAWLTAYASAFKMYPDAAVFGGKIIPFLEPPTPEWFENAKYDWPFNSLLAYRDLGDEAIPLKFTGGKVPYGANFAIRTLEQKRHYYNPELGISPSHNRVGEESDVIYRIFKAGGSGWWVPDSKVTHIIPPKRQTLKYLYDYSFLGGETFAYLRDKFPSDNHLLATGTPPKEYYFGKLHLYWVMLCRIIRYMLVSLLRKKSRFSVLRDIGFYAGAVFYKR
jgi:glycosyltransferase involved in cell wall biosynthesis